LSSIDTICQSWAPRLLSVLRIIVGLLFIEHGTSKFFAFPSGGETGTVALFSLIGLSGVLELVGGVLLTLGLFTRITAFILSGEMAFAYFIAHAPSGFFPLLNHGEPAVFYCFLFLYVAAAGPGPWSVDNAVRRP
jgi:putative oxidoreductase